MRNARPLHGDPSTRSTTLRSAGINYLPLGTESIYRRIQSASAILPLTAFREGESIKTK
ncbi:hypothetical protein DSM3645_26424 [Blastopirellula marina DSM 3645]|uniref:Uncharacterized protein n=1 Tax=Blastopirellula marina DSM 3645 TaxID=314230 RepID=A3ZWJ8_9BACT|nr:hypothetical protein DSM3645_26424 [Blastopirellula marina DSM 3645]